MQFLNNEVDYNNIDNLAQERPVGWSSACLDFTIDYYLNCNFNEDNEEKKNFENE